MLTMPPRLSVKTSASAMTATAIMGRSGGSSCSRARRDDQAGARVLGRARPGEHVADSEADQHLEPRGEMVRIDEGARQPGPRRGLAPSEEPGPAGEVVEEREKRHHPAEEQQRPQQAVEPEARPHEVDDEDVHGGVGEEEAEGSRGLGGDTVPTRTSDGRIAGASRSDAAGPTAQVIRGP